MVPRVAEKGRSFKGAGAYYLHDKKASTNERVAFTMTINLPTDDAEKAIGWMAHTAMRQSEIKKAAGGVAKGRKLRDPVYAYSLSWAPDEQPTQEQMIAAAQETLKVLGLEQHEAVLIAHKDEPHPHIHVIVNRVNPETGIAANLSNDRLLLSSWAEEYERRQGQIRCEQRVENNRRRKREFVKDRDSPNRAEYRRWQRERAAAAYEQRMRDKADLAALQKEERDAVIAARNALIRERRGELKAEQKPEWRDLYRLQRAERLMFEKAQETTFGRLRYWLKNRHIDRFGGEAKDRQGLLARAFQIAVNREHMQAALARKHDGERKALSARQDEYTRRNVGEIYRGTARLLAEVREKQAAERAALRATQLRQREEEARRKALGADKLAFDFGKAKDDPLKLGRPDPYFGKLGAKDPFTHAAENPQAKEQEEGKTRTETAKDFNRAADPAQTPEPATEPAKTPGEPEETKEKKKFSVFRDMRDGKDQENTRDKGRERKGPGESGDDG